MIIPRKEEVAAVVAILDSEEYDDSVSMAKDVIKRVSTILAERDTFGVAIGLHTDNAPLAHGPYWGRADAAKVVMEARSRGLKAFMAPIFGTARALRVDDVEPRTCQCKHQKEQHHASLGCAVYRRGVKCECGGFQP